MHVAAMMDFSRPNNATDKDLAAPQPQPVPTINDDDSELLGVDLSRLSIAIGPDTAKPIINSPVSAPATLRRQASFPRSPIPRDVSPKPEARQAPPLSPLRRSSSSMSTKERATSRASTPSLLRQASMSSLTVTPTRNGRRPSGATRSPLVGLEEDGSAPSKQLHTAASVAKSYFEDELETLHGASTSTVAETVVILHDSCYGHRFSRPRTSKAALSTIVERPERIQASVLGLSVAYVRLGERHAEGKHAPDLPGAMRGLLEIPFRIQKSTRRLPLASPAVTNVHGVKWMEELKIMCDAAENKLANNGRELTRPEMVRSPEQGEVYKFHEGDLYLCAESLEAMEGALGAVCDAIDAIFSRDATGGGPSRAFVTIRPPGHHCSSSYPSGFCWVNNVHVGISYAALNHGVTHAAMIDFDLHHGDGSQAITWAHNQRAQNLPKKESAAWKRTSIGYFSLHDINSHPCEMGDEEKVKNASLCIENAHGQNIWNVHLQPWKNETEFWQLYEEKYSVLLQKTRNFLRTQTDRLKAMSGGSKPKGIIFLSAGFDASEWESPGMQRHKVNVPTEFYARITRDVVGLAAEVGCGVDGRIISVLEGGYSDRALASGTLSHLAGLAAPLQPHIINSGAKTSSSLTSHDYDSAWWSTQNLEALEAIVNAERPAPQISPKKQMATSHYASPTQSFVAKVVDLPTYRRSSANMSPGASSRSLAREPTPPPPDVPWTVAAHELSKILIPRLQRQTDSYRQEDLSAEATRVRKERQLVFNAGTTPLSFPREKAGDGHMALRVRKARAPAPPEEASRPSARTNRRKTVTSVDEILTSVEPVPRVPGYAQTTETSSRRQSLTSTASSGSHWTPFEQPSVCTTTSISLRPGTAMSFSQETAPASAPSTNKKVKSVARAKKAGDLHPKAVASKSADPDLGIDALTSEMKRVGITLLTNAQKEAQEKGAKMSDERTADGSPETLPGPKPAKAAKPRASRTSRSPRKTALKKPHAAVEERAGSAIASVHAVPFKPEAVSPLIYTSTPTATTLEISESPFAHQRANTVRHASTTIKNVIVGTSPELVHQHKVSPSTPIHSETNTTYDGYVLQFGTPASVPLPASTTSTPMQVVTAPQNTKSRQHFAVIAAPDAIDHSTSALNSPPKKTKSEDSQLEDRSIATKNCDTASEEGSSNTMRSDAPLAVPVLQLQAVKEKQLKSVTNGLSTGFARGQLPSFSATGTIPFARKTSLGTTPPNTDRAGKQVDDSIWDVPETPRK